MAMSPDPKAGTACPKCWDILAKRKDVFFHIGIGLWPGLVCEGCKLCMDDPDNSFLEAVAKWKREQLPVSQGAKRCEVHRWEYYGERCEFCSLKCQDCRFLERDVQDEQWDCMHPEKPKNKGIDKPSDDAPEWCPWRRSKLVRISKWTGR
jgi:hypothetical protein